MINIKYLLSFQRLLRGKGLHSYMSSWGSTSTVFMEGKKWKIFVGFSPMKKTKQKEISIEMIFLAFLLKYKKMTSEIFRVQDRQFHGKWKLKSEDFLILILKPNGTVQATATYGISFSSLRSVPIASEIRRGSNTVAPALATCTCEQESRNNEKCWR